MLKVNFTKMFLLFALGVTASMCAAQTVTTLASFDGANGTKPYFGPLVQGPNGKLYGTTFGGGAGNNYGGTVFEIDAAGKLHTLYSFCTQTNCSDGEGPYDGLIVGSNGNLYGTTGYGGVSSNCPSPTGVGCGTIFEVTPGGQLTTLYNFCSQANCSDGSTPQAGLMLARNGNFYGTANGGGIAGPGGTSGGTIFVITPAGKMTTIYRFCSEINSQGSCADGQAPNARLAQAGNGNLYGTTVLGGANSAGTVFEISAASKLTTLYSFCSQRNSSGFCADGESPNAAMVKGADGNLYGTTASGGSTGNGSVFVITPTGGLTTLYSFCSLANCADGTSPEAMLVQAKNGNFYGTTLMGGTSQHCTFSGVVLGCGTVFEITPAGSLSTLHSFCANGCADGEYPYAGLVQGANGRFYGMANAGGDMNCDEGNGCGTVFSFSARPAPSMERHPTTN